MARLKLYTLGPPRLEREGQPVDLRLRKALGLVAYLAVTARAHSRDALATLLWPESDQGEARGRLRRTLHRIGEALGADVLDADRDSLRIQPGLDLWVDCEAFRAEVADAMPGAGPQDLSPTHLAKLAAAVDRYGGDFLAGLTLPDSPSFDEWLFFQRESLRQLYGQALEQLVGAHLRAARGDDAVGYARRWVALDALHEPAQRILMRAYAASGQQAAALRQYQECARVLRAGLGAEPDPETTALYEAIRDHRAPSRAAAGQDAGLARAPDHPRHNLPAQPTSFIGRSTELAELAQLLRQPDARLVTVVGPGGIGKTRLALAAADAARDVFADRVVFVSLAPLASADLMTAALAESLGVQLLASTPPREQLLAYLRPRHVLLILDNFEHLLDAASYLAALLEGAPRLRILVTSRERLNLSGETVYRLDSMDYPPQGALHDALAYGAVQLLMQSARLARPNLAPRDFDLAQMVRICHLVAGMPLALVLAAGWLEVLSFPEIADEIARSLDILESTARDVPARQRSVRAAFDASWSRLPADERLAFAKLSVFRGGFTRQAAHAVAGASLRTLRTLANKSFVAARPDERYEIHELLRQYGEAQLVESGAAGSTADAHADFFLRSVSKRESELKGGRQLEALRDMSADIDNIRAAWRRAVERRDVHAIAGAAEGFCLYHEIRGALVDGEAAFGQAADSLAQPWRAGDRGDVASDGLRGFLLACQGTLRALRGELQEGRVVIEQGLSALRGSGAGEQGVSHEAFALMWLGWALFLQGENEAAERRVQESLDRYGELGDRWGIARNLFILGNSLTARGRLTESEAPLRRSLALCREIGDRRGSLLVNRNLAILAFWFGNYAQTGELLDEAARLSREFDDQIGMAYALRERGKLEAATGAYDRALRTLQQSVAITDEIGSRWESDATLDDVGMALCAAGDYEGAEQTLRQCLDAARSVSNRYYTARCLGDLGAVALRRGDYVGAGRHLREALALWSAIGHEPYMAWVVGQLGSVHEAAGQPTEAREHYREALRLAAAHRLAPFALDTFVHAAALLAGEGESGIARQLLTTAARHSASTHETKEKARRLARSLPVEPDVPAGAESRALHGAEGWQTLAEIARDRLSVG